MTSITCRHASTGYSHVGVFGPVMPAEHTSTSMRPSASAVAPGRARDRIGIGDVERMRHRAAAERPPWPSRAPPASRSQSAIAAPLAASRCATARPMPAAPPVITAVPALAKIELVRAPVYLMISTRLMKRSRTPITATTDTTAVSAFFVSPWNTANSSASSAT